MPAANAGGTQRSVSNLDNISADDRVPMRTRLPRTIIIILLLLVPLLGSAAAQGVVMRGAATIPGLTITPAQDGVVDVRPGENKTLTFSLAWTGNSTFIGKASTFAPPNLTVTASPVELRIEPNSSTNVTLDVSAPSDARTGEAYDVPLVIERTTEPRGMQPQRVVVCVGHDCPPPSNGGFVTSGPGGDRTFRSQRVGAPTGTTPTGNAVLATDDDPGYKTPAPGFAAALGALALAGALWRRGRA